MFGKADKARCDAMRVQLQRHEAVRAALDKSTAVVEFDLDGRVLAANENVWRALGYESEAEIIGQYHRSFCEPAYAASEAYADFWAMLRRGEFFAGRVQRRTRDGRELWLRATYNPLRNDAGEVTGVSKFANDITEAVNAEAATQAKLAAISRSTAVIEFVPDGTILDANENFLAATGYKLDEIRGKHHRIFCDEAYTRTPEYAKLWQSLRSGQFHAGRILRRCRQGHHCWLQASYNPVLNARGEVTSIIKFAYDITHQVEHENRTAESAQLAFRTSQESESLYAAGVSSINRTADEIRTMAQRIEEASSSVRQLGENSTRITMMVETIRSIADRTNLLALNAAIEAARAGEQGRGFAVVADEVRRLAERTRSSTAEIEDVVSDTQRLTGDAVARIDTILVDARQSVSLTEEASDKVLRLKDQAQHVLDAISRCASGIPG